MWGSAGFLIGTVLGSLVLALADRSITKRSFWGRSYCPKCQHWLAWYDLLPIVSYLILAGRCRYCHKKISLEYPITELILGILIAYLFTQSFNLLELLFKTFFITILAILFITDLKKMLIPDRIVKPAILIGVISLFLITIYKIGYLYHYLTLTPIGRKLLPPHTDYFYRHAFMTVQPFLGSILTGFAIGGFFWGLIIVTRGKGMGGGDVKLGAFIGIMLGFPNALVAIVLSFFIGAIFSLYLLFSGKKHFGQVIPFGPFLVLGSLIALFWGSQIIDWYLLLGT